MPTAENALLQYEGGQTVYAMGALTDSGDAKTFDSQASLFSRKAGLEPVVYPNGLATGGAVIPADAGGDNTVDVAALTCYLAGVKTSVGAAVNQSITRPATAVAKVNSITVTSAGAIAVVAGTDGSGANFSETRGGAGGPPYIPVGSIEIAQVRVASNTAAPITADQIFATTNVHVERYNYPGWSEENVTAQVVFDEALPLIHTGDLPKGVYASYADPSFVNIRLASDFVPPENTYSVSSTQVYGGTIGESSKGLGQGSFKAYLDDGIGDALVALEGENLWFRFYPNRNAAQLNYKLCQGALGLKTSYPANQSISANCTISAESAATNKVA
jgi:hypothetical protein